MPLLKHAKKKLKQDKGRTAANKTVRNLFRDLIRKARVAGTPESLTLAFQQIDKAAKKNIIHKNKAGRLKSSLSKAVASGEGKIVVRKATKKTVSAKKASVKQKAAASKKVSLKKKN